MSNILMTKQGFDRLSAEKKEIVEIKIPETNEKLQKAREQGDLSENSAYHAARDEREFLSSRLDELNDMLTSAQIASPPKGVVGIGSTVTVSGKGQKTIYQIVGEFESSPSEKKISYKSPIGSLFIGKKEGDEVEFAIPSGVSKYKILKIE